MPLTRREPKEDAVLACPRDGNPMQKVAIDRVSVDSCGSCGGTWFDAGELRRVTHDREFEHIATHVPIVKTVSPFPCPRCGGECVEAHVSEVAVDTCLGCRGVWLDRGELTEAKRVLKTQRLLEAAGPGFRSFLARM